MRRWQCGSIFIRLAVVASKKWEVAQNSEKIRTYIAVRGHLIRRLRSLPMFALEFRGEVTYEETRVIWGYRLLDLWWQLHDPNFNRFYRAIERGYAAVYCPFVCLSVCPSIRP